ncbi:MAG: helix-turn-helix transcriptional regulator [Bdellovibrionota bacterium]
MNPLVQLLEQKDARAFLKKALVIHFSQKQKINISQFSKKAGFNSRSFLSEYFSGRKNLSLQSFLQIKAALKLPKDYENIFSCLVAIDQPEIASGFRYHSRNQLADLKKLLLKKESVIGLIPKPQGIIAKRKLYRIFAALGCTDFGASLNEIAARTGMKHEEIQYGLNLLSEHNLVFFDRSRFFPKTHQVDFLKLASPELASLTREVCKEISSEAENLSSSKSDLLMYSAFSIDSQNLLQFKEKLRAAVFSVMDEYQSDKGDKVQQLFLCSKF